MSEHEKRIREARWYSVDKSGAATLCTGQDDAIATATDSQVLYPKNGPYEATQLVPVATVSALLAELDAMRGALEKIAKADNSESGRYYANRANINIARAAIKGSSS